MSDIICATNHESYTLTLWHPAAFED